MDNDLHLPCRSEGTIFSTACAWPRHAEILGFSVKKNAEIRLQDPENLGYCTTWPDLLVLNIKFALNRPGKTGLKNVLCKLHTQI